MQVKHGPVKQFTAVLVIPIDEDLKRKLQNKAGRRNMAIVIRDLIRKYVEKEQ